MKNPSKEFMMPFILALTTLLWAEAALETITRGSMHAPTSLAELYLTMMAAYAGTGEVQKWLQKSPADPAEDPWLERAQKGGTFVALWLTLLIAVHLWQLHDHTVPMPIDLKAIATGLVVIFFAKVASRHVRHTRRGVGGPGGIIFEAAGNEESSSARGALIGALREKPEGMGVAELIRRLPDYSRRHLLRELSALTADGSVQRIGNPYARDARYRLPNS